MEDNRLVVWRLNGLQVLSFVWAGISGGLGKQRLVVSESAGQGGCEGAFDPLANLRRCDRRPVLGHQTVFEGEGPGPATIRGFSGVGSEVGDDLGLLTLDDLPTGETAVNEGQRGDGHALAAARIPVDVSV